jgi:hypothetical protein
LEISLVSPAKYSIVPEAKETPGLSAAFKPQIFKHGSECVDSKIMVRTRNGYKPTPAPGDYSPDDHANLGETGVIEKGAKCAFKSKTQRGITNSAIKNSTPFGVYEIQTTVETNGAQSAFKAATRNSCYKIKKSPGPGSYDIDLVTEKKRYA